MEDQRSVWPYIKGYKFNKLLLKNTMIVFLLVTLPLLLVIGINYDKFTTVANGWIMDMNEELLHKNAVVTDNVMENFLDTLNKLSQLEEVKAVVQAEDLDSTYYENVARAKQSVEAKTLYDDFITSMSIYSDINEMLIGEHGVAHVSQSVDKGKWYDIHKQEPMFYPYVLLNHGNSIFICQPIWSATGQRAGLFVLEMEIQELRSLLESQELSQQGLFFVLDANGQIAYCSEKQFDSWDEAVKAEYQSDITKAISGETQLFADHGKRVVSVMPSAHKSWKYAFTTQMLDYQREQSVVRGFLISSLAVGIFSSLIVAYLITLVTYRPIKKIMNVIENPRLHWNEREATKQSNEMLYITSNILAEEGVGDEVSEELEARVRALRHSQFRALQFQIDPHFLYNTLETIKWSAVEEMGLNNKTSKMLTKVARLYRFGLENDDVIVTLKEELDFLKLYIEIVRMRFGDAIQFHWDIDETLYDCNMIKMCLQPIVENAIQHGLRPQKYHGNITISAYHEKECLHISVENDGQVISQGDLRKLNDKLKTGAGFEENKVGLRNVNERIKLIYGKKYGVSVSNVGSDETSEDSVARTRVVLSFPCRNFNRSEETK